ncbi:MAG: hypothetical protein AAGA68_27035 [Pseudomonadota bacterium]
MPPTADNYLPPLPKDFDPKLRRALRRSDMLGGTGCEVIYQETGLHRDTVSYIRKVYGALGDMPTFEAIGRFERGRLKRVKERRKALADRRKAEREAKGISLAEEREVREALKSLRAKNAESTAALTKAAAERAGWNWRAAVDGMTFRSRNWQVPASARFARFAA